MLHFFRTAKNFRRDRACPSERRQECPDFGDLHRRNLPFVGQTIRPNESFRSCDLIARVRQNVFGQLDSPFHQRLRMFQRGAVIPALDQEQ